MVNNLSDSKSDSRNRILEILRNHPEGIGGESVGKRLGISRVAVHKHVRGLKDEGYSVESGHMGYRLSEPDEHPFTTREFPEDIHIRIHNELISTMDEARRRAIEHPEEDFIIAARRQSGGRGRRKRSWYSPEGGLWFTRVIHPERSAALLQLYVMAAASALAGTLVENYQVNARVKWPNDVLVEGRKVAGVLGEGFVSGDRFGYLALGVGMNVNNPTIEGGTGLKELLGRNENLRILLLSWLKAFDSLVSSEKFGNSEVPAWWNDRMAGIGRSAAFELTGTHRAENPSVSISGTVKGCDALGRLILHREDGGKAYLNPGDIRNTIKTGMREPAETWRSSDRR